MSEATGAVTEASATAETAAADTAERDAAITEATSNSSEALIYEVDTSQKDDIADLLGFASETKTPIQEQQDENLDELSEESTSDQEQAAGQETEPAAEENQVPSREDLLMEALRELKSEIAELKKGKEAEKEEKPEEPKDIEFVSENEFTEMFSSPEGLNKTLNTFYQKVRQAAIQDVFPIIQQEATRINTLFAHNQAFFSNNKDLIGKEQLVDQVFKELLAAEPGINIENLFTKGAVEARKRLKLVTNPTVRKPQPPSGFAAPARGGRAPASMEKKTNDQAQQIADLIRSTR